MLGSNLSYHLVCMTYWSIILFIYYSYTTDILVIVEKRDHLFFSTNAGDPWNLFVSFVLSPVLWQLEMAGSYGKIIKGVYAKPIAGIHVPFCAIMIHYVPLCAIFPQIIPVESSSLHTNMTKTAGFDGSSILQFIAEVFPFSLETVKKLIPLYSVTYCDHLQYIYNILFIIYI